MNYYEHRRKKANPNKYKECFCKNCGEKGHIMKFCTHPITSIGIILFYKKANEDYKVLLVSRKDSIGYIDLIRGKFDLHNIKYIQLLLSNITPEEWSKISTLPFKELWDDIWKTTLTSKRSVTKNFNTAKYKFEKLKRGYTHSGVFHSLDNMYAEVKDTVQSNTKEWGFPKGRPKLKESQLQCAQREVFEETCLRHMKDYTMVPGIGPITTVYKGLNGLSYRNIYFVGQLTNVNKYKIKLNTKNIHQSIEIGGIKWHSLKEALGCFRAHNIHKKMSIFKFLESMNKIKLPI